MISSAPGSCSERPTAFAKRRQSAKFLHPGSTELERISNDARFFCTERSEKRVLTRFDRGTILPGTGKALPRKMHLEHDAPARKEERIVPFRPRKRFMTDRTRVRHDISRACLRGA